MGQPIADLGQAGGLAGKLIQDNAACADPFGSSWCNLEKL